MPFTPGFNLAEALELATLSEIIEDVPLPIPLGWTKIFDPGAFPPFDNKWQLWRKVSGPRDTPSTKYAIVVRGTVDTDGSILEDLISLLLFATGTLKIGPISIDYQFAANPTYANPAQPKAAVHLGFALGALILLKFPILGILTALEALVPAGSEVFVTGHSQGAAVATLIRSYLHYGADRPNKNFSYKTYVFAQPKPGNDLYATDFESLFCNTGLAFRVTNSLDWVPQGPLTIEIPSDFNIPNPLTVLSATSISSLTSTQTMVMTDISKGNSPTFNRKWMRLHARKTPSPRLAYL